MTVEPKDDARAGKSAGRKAAWRAETKAFEGVALKAETMGCEKVAQ